MVDGEKKIIIKEDGTKEEIVISLKPDISDGEGVEEEVQKDDDDAVSGGLFKKIMMFFSFFLIAVFTGLVFYVQSVVDENLFKNTLNKTFEDELITSKTKIELTGTPEFKVFPFPHIILRDANIVDYIKSNFLINGTIKTIKIYLNIGQIFSKKIVIEKIDFDELDFIANELSVKAIETPVFFKTESNLKYTFSKGNIKIIGLSYVREFNEISFGLNLDIKEQKHSFSGSLQSNKNEMSINGNFNLIKEEENYKFFNTKIEMSSQSFNIITEMKGTINLDDYSGTITADVNSTQMFIKTIFNTNNFLYQRVIDNSPLKFNSNFDFHNDIFAIRNFTIAGKNINGDIEGIIHLKEDNKNYINAIFNNIDSDILLIRNLTPSSTDSKSDIKPDNVFFI
ncbi:MAG: hypothetical protein Ta2D_04250 [Rickettsiales bacterium]|nr:MAG: hypothetical protein Ta2D_04250 [Rickettsiales bacterium]